jgi:hypothetical protein
MLRGGLSRGCAAAASMVVLALLAGCQPTGAAPTAEQQLQPMPRVQVGFTRPAGFEVATGYKVSIPLESTDQEQPQLQTIVPTGTAGGYDVISIITYRLDIDTGTAAPASLRSRVNGYAPRVHATEASTPVSTTVGGHPAWSQSVTQPGGPPGGYTYDTVYIFDAWFLVQVMCQYEDHPDSIHQACTDVLASLDLRLT